MHNDKNQAKPNKFSHHNYYAFSDNRRIIASCTADDEVEAAYILSRKLNVRAQDIQVVAV